METVTREAIEKLFDLKVRPGLSLHGGNIEILDFTAGVLSVRLLGQCSNCPSAGLTMENLVRAELAGAFPLLKQIVLESGVSEGLIREARSILKKRKSGEV